MVRVLAVIRGRLTDGDSRVLKVLTLDRIS